ncbi:helicase-primase subunit BBLF4 [Anopheles sinensis]|uniref:Helicase-primase subunit BBLF4 n=1 Tax=Anopheles sinensis TaxID=74873 RepID=A0A084WHL0_ANOSI|nr:helicase-primase subunit BBLF4 [Anopheles sinensis]
MGAFRSKYIWSPSVVGRVILLSPAKQLPAVTCRLISLASNTTTHYTPRRPRVTSSSLMMKMTQLTNSQSIVANINYDRVLNNRDRASASEKSSPVIVEDPTVEQSHSVRTLRPNLVCKISSQTGTKNAPQTIRPYIPPAYRKTGHSVQVPPKFLL